jgi:hypothetical protein
MIFDEKTFTIYEMSLGEEGMLWRHPAYVDAYNTELQEKRGIYADDIAKRQGNAEPEEMIELLMKKYEPAAAAPKPSGLAAENPYTDIDFAGYPYFGDDFATD